MGTLLNGSRPPEVGRFKGCDGTGLYAARLFPANIAGPRTATFEGGPWNTFFITSSKLEDWTGGSTSSNEVEMSLDDGPYCRLFAGSWMRTGLFSKFYVRSNKNFGFSAINFTVFLTRAPGFNAGFFGAQGAWQ